MLLPINIKAEQHEKKITTRTFTALCLIFLTPYSQTTYDYH